MMYDNVSIVHKKNKCKKSIAYGYQIPLISSLLVFRTKIPVYNEFELCSDHKGTNVRWMYVFKMAY
jgi:hypothetical protein